MHEDPPNPLTHTNDTYSMIARPIRLYKGWHKHYRALVLSSLRAHGLWVCPSLMQVASLAFFTLPVGFVNSTESLSNVILWTLGKKAKALKKRKAEETAGGHSKSCLKGDLRDYHDQEITKRWMVETRRMPPQSTVYACQHMFAHACAHILYMHLLGFKSAKSKLTKWKDDGTSAEVRLSDVWIYCIVVQSFTYHFSESNI